MSQNNFNIVLDGSRKVGIVENGVYCRTIKSGHFLKSPPAISFSIQSLNSAASLGATSFRVENKETKDVYTLTWADFEQHKFLVDRGFGRQYAVRLEKWITILNINSRALKPGETKFKPASKSRTRNAPSVAKIPAQLFFKNFLGEEVSHAHAGELLTRMTGVGQGKR